VEDVLVIGGGLAGLAAARRLGTRAHLLEAADRVGGLARTDFVQGFGFDWTGHWLHLRRPRWQSEVRRLLAPALDVVRRRALVRSCGVFTPYPYQVHTFGLPPEVLSDCVSGFLAARMGSAGAELRARGPRNAREAILRDLGEGFLRHFMEPYNAKLYTVPTDRLSAEWGGRFVPKVKLEEVFDGALGRICDSVGYNATFVYPSEGGIERLAQALARELTGPVSLGVPVRRVDAKLRRVHLADGRVLPWKTVVATLPLPVLARMVVPCPRPVAEAAQHLRAVGVTVVELGVRGPARVPFHWCYFPEPRFAFYRVGSPSQVCASLAPAGHTSYSVEFSWSGSDPEANEREDQAIDGLESAGILERRDVVFSRRRAIPTAYVLFDAQREQARRVVLEHLERAGVVAAGRFGLWEYSGMEDALVSGEEAADRAAAGMPA